MLSISGVLTPALLMSANGGTHTTWEDVAVMRTLPSSVVCVMQLMFAKRLDCAQLPRWMVLIPAHRSARMLCCSQLAFEIGKGNVVPRGAHFSIVRWSVSC